MFQAFQKYLKKVLIKVCVQKKMLIESVGKRHKCCLFTCVYMRIEMGPSGILFGTVHCGS